MNKEATIEIKITTKKDGVVMNKIFKVKHFNWTLKRDAEPILIRGHFAPVGMNCGPWSGNVELIDIIEDKDVDE